MRKKIKFFLFLPFCFSLFACRTSEPVSSNTAGAVNETLLGLQKRSFTKFTGVFYRESGGEKVFICPRFLLSLSTDQPFVVGNEYRFSLAEETEFSYYFDQPIRLDEDEVQIECVNDYSNQPGKHLTFCMIEEHYSGPSFGNLYDGPYYACSAFTLEQENDILEPLAYYADKIFQTPEEIKSLCYSLLECMEALQKAIDKTPYLYDFDTPEDGDFVFIRSSLIVHGS